MAKKSKTQKAKASANRAAKKARAAEQSNVVPVVEEAPKKSFFGKKNSAETKPASKPAKETKRLLNLRSAVLVSFPMFALNFVV